MGKLLEIWQWLSGKKTLIGAVCVWIATALIGDLVIGQFAFEPAWLTWLQGWLMTIGTWLTPIGLAHKLGKVANTKA